MINIITHNNVYDLDLQRARETKHNKDLTRRTGPNGTRKTLRNPSPTSVSILRPFTGQTKPRPMGKTSQRPRKDRESPPPKDANHLESAMATQKRQISSLTAQNKKMIAALVASGIEIPRSNPSPGKEDDEDRKKAAK